MVGLTQQRYLAIEQSKKNSSRLITCACELRINVDVLALFGYKANL